MEGSSFFSVQRLGDKHVAVDGIYVVDTTRGLISACSGDAVADAHILILIRADLRTEPEKQVEQRGKSFFFFLVLSSFACNCNKKYKMFRAEQYVT